MRFNICACRRNGGDTHNSIGKGQKPMILAIDVGNTNTKYGFFGAGGTLDSFFSIPSDAKRTVKETSGLILRGAAEIGINAAEVHGAAMSSVIPKATGTVTAAAERVFGVRPIAVSPALDLGMEIDYLLPASLGSDRIVTCVAAKKKYGAPFVLVDFGTATTVNAVDGRGAFVGGAITLGIKSTMASLVKCTAKLPCVEPEIPRAAVGKSTADAIRSGVVLGAAGQIKYLISLIKKELGLDNAKTIATGGLAALVQEIDPMFDVVDKGLSLEGLYEIYKRNRIDNK